MARERTRTSAGEVEAFGAGGRHDVSGVAGEKEAAIPHRLGNETAHRGGGLLLNQPLPHREVAACLETRVQLVPDAVVRPPGEVFFGSALQVEAADRGRTHTEQCESTLVARVDQLFRCRRRLREDAQPCERIDLLEELQGACWNRRAADSMEAVASPDEVAADLVLFILMHEADARVGVVEVVNACLVGVKPDRSAGGEPGSDQILDDFVLSVDGDRTAGESVQVDAVSLAAEAQFDTVMDEPFTSHPIAGSGGVQQIDGALFQHAGADPLFHLAAAAAFDHYRLDSFQMQEVGKQKARRSGSHDADLSPDRFHREEGCGAGFPAARASKRSSAPIRSQLAPENIEHGAGSHGDALAPVDAERNGIGGDAPAGLKVPERLAGLSIEREEVAFVRTGKDQAAASREHARPRRGVQWELPSHLASGGDLVFSGSDEG